MLNKIGKVTKTVRRVGSKTLKKSTEKVIEGSTKKVVQHPTGLIINGPTRKVVQHPTGLIINGPLICGASKEQPQGFLGKIKAVVVNLFDSRTPWQKAMDAAYKHQMEAADAVQVKNVIKFQKDMLDILR